jgi:hypothetical protein
MNSLPLKGAEMFISKAEKEDLFYRIAVLEQTVLAMKTSMAYKPEPKSNKGRTWSPEQRARASEQMKKIWINKKEKA